MRMILFAKAANINNNLQVSFLLLIINTFRLVLFALSQSKFWKRLEKILKAAGYFAMHLTPPIPPTKEELYM